MGMFYRTIRMLEHGIKPVYVFDGKPPQLKSAEVSEDFTWILPGLKLKIFQYSTKWPNGFLV